MTDMKALMAPLPLSTLAGQQPSPRKQATANEAFLAEKGPKEFGGALWTQAKASPFVLYLGAHEAFFMDAAQLEPEQWSKLVFRLFLKTPHLTTIRFSDSAASRTQKLKVASKKKGARRADMLAELQRVIPLGIARQQSRLVHFELNGVRCKNIGPLAAALKDCGVLERLYLRNVNLKDEGVTEILSAVHALNLKHLAMAGCEITHRSGGGLCRLILTQASRREDVAWRSNLRNDRNDTPVDLVQHGLQTLDLSNNQLGDAGVAMVCETLSRDSWLLAVDLRNNKFDEVGLNAVLSLLKYNSTLIKVFVVGRVKRMSLQQLNDAAAAALSAGAASERDGSGSAQSSARVAALRTEQLLRRNDPHRKARRQRRLALREQMVMPVLDVAVPDDQMLAAFMAIRREGDKFKPHSGVVHKRLYEEALARQQRGEFDVRLRDRVPTHRSRSRRGSLSAAGGLSTSGSRSSLGGDSEFSVGTARSEGNFSDGDGLGSVAGSASASRAVGSDHLQLSHRSNSERKHRGGSASSSKKKSSQSASKSKSGSGLSLDSLNMLVSQLSNELAAIQQKQQQQQNGGAGDAAAAADRKADDPAGGAGAGGSGGDSQSAKKALALVPAPMSKELGGLFDFLERAFEKVHGEIDRLEAKEAELSRRSSLAAIPPDDRPDGAAAAAAGGVPSGSAAPAAAAASGGYRLQDVPVPPGLFRSGKNGRKESAISQSVAAAAAPASAGAPVPDQQHPASAEPAAKPATAAKAPAPAPQASASAAAKSRARPASAKPAVPRLSHSHKGSRHGGRAVGGSADSSPHRTLSRSHSQTDLHSAAKPPAQPRHASSHHHQQHAPPPARGFLLQGDARAVALQREIEAMRELAERHIAEDEAKRAAAARPPRAGAGSDIGAWTDTDTESEAGAIARRMHESLAKRQQKQGGAGGGKLQRKAAKPVRHPAAWGAGRGSSKGRVVAAAGIRGSSKGAASLRASSSRNRNGHSHSHGHGRSRGHGHSSHASSASSLSLAVPASDLSDAQRPPFRPPGQPPLGSSPRGAGVSARFKLDIDAIAAQIESRSLDDGLRAEAQAAGQRRSERQRSFDARAVQSASYVSPRGAGGEDRTVNTAADRVLLPAQPPPPPPPSDPLDGVKSAVAQRMQQLFRLHMDRVE